MLSLKNQDLLSRFENDQKQLKGTYSCLNFQDYMSVIPKEKFDGAKQYKGDGTFFRCFTHGPDNDPSLLIKPGDDVACVWKCFSGCRQEQIQAVFNKWLLAAGKLIPNNLPTRTLDGLKHQGALDDETYWSIIEHRKRKRGRKQHNYINSIRYANRQQNGSWVTPPADPIPSSKSSLDQFLELQEKLKRGYYGS